MKIKNGDVDAFADFLLSFDLGGRESRMRTRFHRLLMERKSLIKEEHAELIRQFAKFDDKGEPYVVEFQGKQAYDITDRIGFNREFFLLMNEDFIIEENEERKEMLMLIKDIILNCQKTFSGRDALEYDNWCEIVEEIKYE